MIVAYANTASGTLLGAEDYIRHVRGVLFREIGTGPQGQQRRCLLAGPVHG